MSANIKSFAMQFGAERPWWAGATEEIPTFPVNAHWEEVVKAANLDWSVSLQPVYNNNGSKIEGYYSVQRDDNLIDLAVVQSRYRPAQNKDCFSMLNEIVNGNLQFHTAGSLGLGETIWALTKLAGQIRVIGNDVVDKFLLLSNSHNGTSKLRIKFTPVRVVCQNTLRQAELDGNFLFEGKHTENLPKKISQIKNLFIQAEQQAKEFEQNAKLLVCKTVSDEQVEAFLYDVLGYGREFKENFAEIPTKSKNVAEKMIDLYHTGKGTEIPGVKGSLWGAYNAVTEYVDHFATVKNEDKDPTNRLRSIWFGNGEQVKNKAFNKAIAL